MTTIRTKMVPEMREKEADIEAIAAKVIEDSVLLSELLEGLKSKEEIFRYNCHKVLMKVTDVHPEIIYPSWDFFMEHLKSNNSYHKMSATHLIANLVKVDDGNRFVEIFDLFYGLLDDRSMVVAYYVAQNSAKIIKAKPELENRIIARLLAIDETHHPTGRKELIKTGIIEAFDELFEDSGVRPEIMDFVRAQIDSESHKTAKAAKAFLEKWEG
jgi:hypothetical protein